MGKVRIGLTAALMLILLGIFSAVAFAEEGIPPTSTNPAPGVNVGSVDNFGSQSTHRTHGNFQNNTNSCANCHSTHNGEDDMLLMKDGEYELCMSCHNGTMGFYNVTKGSGAGTFDDSHLSSSMHNVNSGMVIGEAPGKYLNKSTDILECSSCHNPHGSPNDRLLKETIINNEPFAFTGTPASKQFVTLGTKTISLELTEDTEYAEINKIAGTGGLKITKSVGPKAGDYSKVYYSQFCSACHDDYFAKRRTGKPSASTSQHPTLTHTTNTAEQGRNCAACHYAHGTDVTTLTDALGRRVADYTKPISEGGKFGWSEEKAQAYLKDVSKNGSALKKYTGMAVCFACHADDIGIVDPAVAGPDGAHIGKQYIR
jgi:predicted CXXCH cytochrome family protein